MVPKCSIQVERCIEVYSLCFYTSQFTNTLETRDSIWQSDKRFMSNYDLFKVYKMLVTYPSWQLYLVDILSYLVVDRLLLIIV